MPAPNTITADKLARLIGTPAAPALVDLRRDPAGRRIPGALPYLADAITDWGRPLAGNSVVVIDEDGGTACQGIAAWLRSEGVAAESARGRPCRLDRRGPTLAHA